MKRKGVIYLFVFAITLINALTVVAYGSSVTSMGNMSTSGYEKNIEPGSMNLSVKPGDDFYEYAEGGWIKSHPIPADKERYGEFDIVADKIDARIKGIVEGAVNNTSAPEGSLERKIGEFYRVGMDNATREKQGIDPIKDELRVIDNISNKSDLQVASTQMMDYGLSPLFSVYADTDAKNNKVMIATLSQGGIAMYRDFYLGKDANSIVAREKYLTHVAKMFVYLGDSQKVAEENAGTVMRIETRLANASFNNVDNNDVIKTYNKMSLKELQAFAPGMNWSLMFITLGHPDVTEVNVKNPSYFKELSTALQNESVADWKTFLRWKLISATSPFLTSEMEEENFNLYAGGLNGQQKLVMAPRWKRVIDVENIFMGEAIGHIYVDKYFDPNSKAKIQEEMVPNLKKAFRARIQNLTWMEPETKKKALIKLENADIQVGYPDEWLNYSELEVKNDSYVQNVLRASKFYFYHGTRGLDRIGKPVDRRLWEMNPQTTDARADYYNMVIVFPAGILQPPFFNKTADDTINYGAIGFIIGHEMTHLFDNLGRHFDPSGNLTEWWTLKDAENFNNSTRVLVDEYNKFEVLPGVYINGNLTLPENIADFGGLTMAYHAYNLSSKEELEIIDGFTGDQRFFLSYTRVWRGSATNAYLWKQALIDPHSPFKFRVNGVVYNMPEFYKTFPSIKPGDKLYRPESERPVIW
jgi:putative endopeptidase